MKNFIKIMLCIMVALIALIAVFWHFGPASGQLVLKEGKDKISQTDFETKDELDEDSLSSEIEDEMDTDSLLSETEDVQNDEMKNVQETLYRIEDYGTVQENKHEFFYEETGDVSYYYEMEKFFFYDSFPNAAPVNQTLQHIYDRYENYYTEGEETHKFGEDKPLNTPYTYWHILSIEYVGEDYVSILYNDVDYMGGAHPYSLFDGITIDCKTGNEISASQFLRKNDEEILAEISSAMGFDDIGTWDDIDFYLTDSTIVFFYRMPGFWEDVVLQRKDISKVSERQY